LLGERIFERCLGLEPVDVISGAKIEGDFKVVARVTDYDGSKARRLRFSVRLLPL
jgi:hypothetical protein